MPDPIKIKNTCPSCGSSDGIYGRADVRWDHKEQEWVPADIEYMLDCTQCDADFTLEEFEAGVAP